MSPGDLKLEDRLDRIEQKLDWVVEHVTILRVKASLYGAISGLILGGLVSILVTQWS